MDDKKVVPGLPPLLMPEDLAVHYSNLTRISHTPSEFVFDFAAMLPGAQPKILARILMSPIAAKLFLQAMTENLARYENNFGPIEIPSGQPNLANTLFRNIHPPENPDKAPEPPESEI
ncbi:MAG: hypothetical protein BGO78_13210 [Chloroflexi bacterium 44-23]|mgnify:CR=1 FL=1|nr:MAG: hypothetical protein BGO78_13210 [Chloroflexi bacterium 44-23]